jgi:hypothetical protein
VLQFSDNKGNIHKISFKFWNIYGSTKETKCLVTEVFLFLDNVFLSPHSTSYKVTFSQTKEREKNKQTNEQSPQLDKISVLGLCDFTCERN